jgi:hypothetical protein
MALWLQSNRSTPPVLHLSRRCAFYIDVVCSKFQKSQKAFWPLDKLFASLFGMLFVGIVTANDRCS